MWEWEWGMCGSEPRRRGGGDHEKTRRPRGGGIAVRITEPRTRRGALTALFTLGETYREGAATPAPLEHKQWTGGIDCEGIDNSCTRLGEGLEKRELRITYRYLVAQCSRNSVTLKDFCQTKEAKI